MQPKRIVRIAAAVLIAGLILPRAAAADDWVRADRPWTSDDVSKAMAFCRLQPRVDPNIGLFVDMVTGRQIQTCMYALGWVGVAR